MKQGATSEQIDEYLRLFDSPIDAVHAIRQHLIAQTALNQPKIAPSRDLGQTLIETSDLKKTYRIGRQHISALDGISISVRQGEFVALTGPSGSGKSTLLQLIGGLDKPTSGSVVVDGHNLNKLSDRKLALFRNKTVGFIFQFFYLQPFLQLHKNLEVAAMPLRTKRKERQTRITELAQAVGVEERLQHLPRELSGGQMQRAAIARALVNNPKIILADEPTGNLDSKNSLAIIELLEQIRNDFGTTIIIVTHDKLIAQRADREIQLKDGVVL